MHSLLIAVMRETNKEDVDNQVPELTGRMASQSEQECGPCPDG